MCNKFASLYMKNLSLGPPEPVEMTAMRIITPFTARNGQDEILHGAVAALLRRAIRIRVAKQPCDVTFMQKIGSTSNAARVVGCDAIIDLPSAVKS